MGTIISWLFVLALIGGTTANPVSIPNEKIYAYHAKTFVHNSVSSERVSQFDIFAKLIYQGFDEYAIIKLNDVKVSAFNGNRTGHEDFSKVDVNDDSKAFMEPFIYYYNNTIAIKNDDAHWSINMKRSIAGILHTNKEVISKKEEHDEEENLYGHCDVKYEYNEESDGTMKVNKMIDISKCKYTTIYMWPKNNLAKCTKHDLMKREIVRSYYYRDKSNLDQIDRIESNYIFTFKDSPEAKHHIEMQQIQTFELTHSGDISEKIDPTKIINLKKMSYVPKGTPLERSDIKKSLTTAELSKDALENLKSLKEELIKPTTENTYDIHLIIQNTFKHIEDQSLESIEEIMNTINEDNVMKHLFMSLLPYMGNQETVQYIEKLIKSKDIEIYEKIKLLSLFPQYVYGNNIKVLDFLLDLAEEERVVRNSGVLAHSELVAQAINYGAINVDTYKEYMGKYLEVFKNNKDYETRMVYLLGLHNMNANLDVWMPIIMDSNESRHLRLIAIQCAFEHMKKEPLKVKSELLSLFKDESLSIELRLAALDTLIEINLPLDMYDEIYEYLKDEPRTLVHKHIYDYFYTKLRSNLVPTKCGNNVTDISRKYFRKLKAPRSHDLWTSSNLKTSFTNNGVDFGYSAEVKMFGTPNTRGIEVFQITLDSFAMNIDRKLTVFIKMHGVVEDMFNDFFKHKPGDIDKYIKDFIKIIEDNKLKLLHKSIDFHLEVIVLTDDKVTFAAYFDPTSFENINFKKVYSNIMNLLSKDQTSFSYPAMTYIYVLSDLGSDIELSLEEEIIKYMNIDMEPYISGNVYGDYKYIGRVYSTTMKTLEVFNPLTNLKHGASSVSIDNIYKEIPLSLNNVENYKAYLEINNNELVYTMQSEILRKTYVNDEKTLHDYCEDCSHIDIFQSDQDETKKSTLPILNLGLSYEIKGTNIEKYYFQSYMSTLSNDIIGNFIAFPFSYLEYLILSTYYYRAYNPSFDTLKGTVSLKNTKNNYPIMTVFSLKAKSQHIDSNEYVFSGEYDEIIIGLNQVINNTSISGVNITFYLEDEPGKINTTFGFKLSVEYELNFMEVGLDWKTSFPPELADKYSIEPANPTSSKINFNFCFGREKPSNECPPRSMSISVDIDGIYTVMDNQKEHPSVQKCKKQSENKKYTPPTLVCEEATREMSTYHNYLFNGSLNDGRIDQNFSLNIEYTKTLDNYPKIVFSGNFERQDFDAVIYPPSINPHYIELFLLDSREEIHDEVSPISTCAVTKDFVNTFNNSMIKNYDNNGEIVAWIECEHAYHGLTYKVREDNLLEMTAWIDDNKVVVKPDGSNLKVLLNDDEFDKSEWVRSNDFKIYFLADDVLQIRGKMISVTYNTEYIHTEMFSYYNGMICGICSPQENIIKVKH